MSRLRKWAKGELRALAAIAHKSVEEEDKFTKLTEILEEANKQELFVVLTFWARGAFVLGCVVALCFGTSNSTAEHDSSLTIAVNTLYEQMREFTKELGKLVAEYSGGVVGVAFTSALSSETMKKYLQRWIAPNIDDDKILSTNWMLCVVGGMFAGYIVGEIPHLVPCARKLLIQLVVIILSWMVSEGFQPVLDRIVAAAAKRKKDTVV